MLNKEYVEKYNKLTGRDLAEDTQECFKEFFNLTNMLKKYGIKETKVCLTLWHNGVTVEDIELINNSQTEWQVMQWLGEKLNAPRIKEMPLVAAGIVPAGDEN
jgi:hypothetical protein